MRHVPFFNSRQTAEGACADRRCIRVQGAHGGLTPPALVLQCERLPAKNDFCDARTHVRRSGGREPAVGVGNALATPIPLTSGDTRHVQRQERRTSARRGCGQRTCNGASTKLRQPPTVRVPIAGAFASRLTRGANAPRSCVAVRTSAGEKNHFCDAQTHVRRSGGRQPAVRARNSLRRHKRDRSADCRRCMCASPLRSPLIITTGG
jgi:hypothetical protein